VEEDGYIVHLVLKHCQSLEVVQVNLAEELQLVHRRFENQLAVGADVPRSFVFVLLVEDFLAGHLVAVVVATKAGGHAKVVQEEWMLVNVLEETELALVERELEPVFEVVLRVQLVLDVIVLFLHWYALDCRVSLLLLEVLE